MSAFALQMTHTTLQRARHGARILLFQTPLQLRLSNVRVPVCRLLGGRWFAARVLPEQHCLLHSMTADCVKKQEVLFLAGFLCRDCRRFMKINDLPFVVELS